MAGRKIQDYSREDLTRTLATIIDNTYIYAGKNPSLFPAPAADLAGDLAASFKGLAIDEVQLAFRAGVCGELTETTGVNYSHMVKWLNAYAKHPQVLDARKILTAAPARKSDDIYEGLDVRTKLARFRASLAAAAGRRYEDIRTQGRFRQGSIPHVSAQIYRWLQDEGLIRQDGSVKRGAMERARKRTAGLFDLETGEALARSWAMEECLLIWMDGMIHDGRALVLPDTIQKFYD